MDLWTLTVSQGFAEKGPVVPEIMEVMKMFALSPGVECYLARVDGKLRAAGPLAIRGRGGRTVWGEHASGVSQTGSAGDAVARTAGAGCGGWL